MDRTCEAQALALEGFGDDSVPPCDEPGAVAFGDRWLCAGCADALQRIRGLARSLTDRGALGEEQARG